MRHLDREVNVPAWGFKNWREYYIAATITAEHLKKMRCPVIFLNSVDDPLIKDDPDTDAWFTDTDKVMLVKTPAGGHAAWWGQKFETPMHKKKYPSEILFFLTYFSMAPS